MFLQCVVNFDEMKYFVNKRFAFRYFDIAWKCWFLLASLKVPLFFIKLTCTFMFICRFESLLWFLSLHDFNVFYAGRSLLVLLLWNIFSILLLLEYSINLWCTAEMLLYCFGVYFYPNKKYFRRFERCIGFHGYNIIYLTFIQIYLEYLLYMGLLKKMCLLKIYT